MEGLYEYSNVKDFLDDYNKLSFPYQSLYYTDDDKKSMLDNLSKYDHKKRLKRVRGYTVKNLAFHTNVFKFEGIPTILENDESDYKDFNILSNLFIEDIRMRCKVYGTAMSPMDYYQKFRRRLAEDCLKQYGKITPHYLRETLWGVKMARECTTFRPANLVACIQKFFPNYKKKPIRILDPSSGWGDRLLAAMATKSIYYGVDPNTKLFPYYNKMIKFFGGSRQKYKMLNAPFETVKLTKAKYDMVFTSPPYFDLEHYSDDKTQSDVKNTTERDWFDHFLRPYIKTAWDALADNGVMVIVINQKNRTEHYIEWMLDYVNDFGKYLGIISYANPEDYTRTPQPMFIWRKTDFDVLKTARLTLRKFQASDAKAFSEIQSKKSNMSRLGSGRTKSTSESTKQMMRYISEYTTETYARFYPIIYNGKMAGYIGYYKGDDFNHPMLKNKYLLRVLVDAKFRGEGFASEITHIFLAKYAYKHIHMMVEIHNTPSNKLFGRYTRRMMAYKGKKYYLYDSQNLFKKGGRRRFT